MPMQKPALALSKSLRPKLIHCIGGHALVKLETVSNPFTGMFQGANYGIARLSSSSDPNSLSLSPSMGLKFLRDGMDSANTVLQFQGKGQPGEWNFFEHELYSMLDPKGGMLALLPILFKASFFTDYVWGVGSSEMAQYTESGHNVGKAVFPYKLDFTPPKNIKNMFSNSEPKDHLNYINDFKRIPSGSILYEVFGWTAPPQIGGKRVKIGNLKMESALTTSQFGDKDLFFRH